MNRWQKMAWFNLVVVAITIGVAAAAVIVFTLMTGMLSQGALYGLSFGGVIVFSLISPLIFRAKKQPGEVSFDERDEQIRRKADKASDNASLGLFVAVCMGGLLAVGPNGSVPVMTLPYMVCWAFIAAKIAESVATLIQYGWRNKNHE